MATLYYSPPVLFIPPYAKSPYPTDWTAGAGHTGTAVIQEADIVVASAGTLARAATNASANIVGLAQTAETATYSGTATPWTYGAYNQLPWGFSQVGTILPSNPGQIPVFSFSACFLDISLRVTNGWITGGTYQVTLGSTGGLYLDTVTNLYVFDFNQSNKIFEVVEKPQGPNQGVAGDLGARVRVKVTSGTIN